MIWNDFSMLISILILCAVSIFGLYHTTDIETNADIIEQFTTMTTTECIMVCMSNPKCDSIARDGNYCLLLTRTRNATKSKGNVTFHAIKPMDDNVTFSTKQSQVTCCKWSEFSECSKTCGFGIRMRTRACYDENENLVRIENSTENCTKQECPLACIRTTGGTAGGACCVFPFTYQGKTYHECTNANYHTLWCGTHEKFPDPYNWGDCIDLVRIENSTENCTKQECPPTCREWSQFDACSKTCGTGDRKRSRGCYNDKGILVRTDDSTENCNEQECPPTCREWSQFDTCSKTCGTGERKRSRGCYNDKGILVRTDDSTENCNEQECPPTCREWSQFDTCSKTCGTGERKRSRGCYNDKGILVRTDDSTENCNEQECPPTCREWSQFDTCSKTCGTGERKRSRGCYNDKGILVRTDDSTENCNEQDCPVACIRTTGGTAGGACCVFPFTYNGNIYHACTNANHHTLWCGTHEKFPDPYNWGDCID